MKDTLGLIFAYQNEDQMKSLTLKRALSSIPFGGRYRVVDFALSSLVNSGVSKVGIITRNNYQSLMDHLGNGKEWDLSRKKGGLSILPPFVQKDYAGEMEALRNALAFIRKSTEKYVILSSADAIFNMTFDEVLAYHKEKQADITVVYKKAPIRNLDSNVGSGELLKINGDGRLTDVAINPPVGTDPVLSSMSQVIMEKALLERLIEECASHNLYSFHGDVLMRRLNDLRIYGYEYTGYYARINSVAAYYAASMDLLDADIRSELFYQDDRIYTKIRDEAPTMYRGEGKASHSLIADGCVIEGTVENSILFRGVRVKPGAVVKDSIIMQGGEIGAGARIGYAVLDKEVTVRDNRMLLGYSLYPLILDKGAIV